MKKLNLFFFTSLIIPFTLNAQIIFEEDFDDITGSGTEFPDNWLLFNVDNNVPAAEVAEIDQAWKRLEDPEIIGDSVAISTSYYTNFGQADDWMWTPEINIPSTGNSVLSWDAHSFSSDFRDGYEVRIMQSPNTPTGGLGDIGNLVSASTLLFSVDEEFPHWNNHFLMLDETYNGQTVRIGFRNNSTDKYLLAIDDIEIQHSNAPLQQRIYVKKGSSGDGRSWINAMGELADALVYAKNQNNTTPGSISEIWVAGGTYHPLYSPDDSNFGNPDNRNNAFLLLKGVAFYGGFAGTENSIEERDLNNTSNNSILSGDLLDDDVISGNGEGVLSISNNLENTYHVVVTVSNDTSELLIDGFEIVSGNANGSNSLIVGGHNIFQNLGGGFYALYSDFEATNLKFNYNTNNGLYIANSTISVANSTFSYNIAVNGAGIRNQNSELEVSNSDFFMNIVSNDGGAIYNGNNGITRINNSEIHQNSATNNGGGIFSGSTSQTFINNSKLYVNNAGWMGGVIYGISGSLSMVNSLIYKNTAEFGGAIGMFSKTNATIITNSTFYDNSATNQGYTIGVDFNSSEPENLRTIHIYNSILWGNDDFTGNNLISENWGIYQLSNSILQYPGSGYNINGTYQNIDPEFTDTENNDYMILNSSPAKNSGDNSLYELTDGDENNNSLWTDKDLAYNNRLFGDNIDIGAYEVQSNCSAITIWDGFAWSNGTPDFNKLAIIDGNLILDENLEACEIQVNSNGNLTISNGFTFTSNGRITNNATPDDFVVQNGGNLIQIENDENIGEITVQRNSQPMILLDYTLWSSPVLNQNLFGFSPETVNGVTNYIGSTGRIYIYDGSSGYINPNPFNESSIMNSGTGYLFRSPNNFDATVPMVYEGFFMGIPFNGDLSVATVPNNYTSIGNPYPSNIDADALITENTGLNTLYFWVNTPIIEGEYVGNNYATYTLAGGTSNTGETSGEGVPSRTISTGQGFIVETSDPNINFNNAMRTNLSTDFFKISEIEKHRLWLNLSDENNFGLNQILVAYMEGATLGYDSQIDGQMFNYQGSAIYSLIENKEFTIQGRTLPFDEEDIVPIGFRTVENGKYTISLDHSDGLFVENQRIYLKDNSLNLIHDLTISHYEFESEAGTFNERFEIVYKDDEIMNTNDLTADFVQIYKDGKEIVVASESEKIVSIELFDSQGRLIHKKDEINASIYKVKATAREILIIRVLTQSGKIKTKKIFN